MLLERGNLGPCICGSVERVTYSHIDTSYNFLSKHCLRQEKTLLCSRGNTTKEKGKGVKISN